MDNSSSQPNHYEILQIQPYANPALIIAAFRILSKVYHPDTAREAADVEKFRLIQEAYEVLSDATRRLDYDRELRMRSPGANFAGAYTTHGYRPEPEARDPLWENKAGSEVPYTPPTEEELEFFKSLYTDEKPSRRRKGIALIMVYVLLMAGAVIFLFVGILTAANGNAAEKEYTFFYFMMAGILLILAQLEAYFS